MLPSMRALVCLLSLAVCSTAFASEASNVAATSSQATEKAPESQVTYLIRPGDLLRVTVWKEEELDRDVLILPDGTMDFPLIGSIKAEGLSTAQLQAIVKEKLIPFIPAASVTIIVKETRGNVVSVIGQVSKPGDIVMNRDLTVMQALSQVGGLTAYADEDITILRKIDGKETSIPFDYSRVSSGRDLDTNIILAPGDVIVVPTASLF